MAESFLARLERERQAAIVAPGVPTSLLGTRRGDYLLLRDGREVMVLGIPDIAYAKVYVLDCGETFSVKFDTVAAVIDYEELGGIRSKIYRR